MKRYHSKYVDQMQYLQKRVPKFNVKQTIKATVDSTKQIASSAQSTAKRVSTQSQKVASSVTTGITSTKQTMAKVGQISPSKIAENAAKPIHSTYRATQRLLSPRRY